MNGPKPDRTCWGCGYFVGWLDKDELCRDCRKLIKKDGLLHTH